MLKASLFHAKIAADTLDELRTSPELTGQTLFDDGVTYFSFLQALEAAKNLTDDIKWLLERND